tara:strand:+ start:837 stop:1835 length:999 start_codon:yes stop_codon:yes gene_type:complete
MKKIYITDYFYNAIIEKKIFGRTAKVLCIGKKNKKSYLKQIQDADGLLVWHADINYNLIKSLKKCKAIVRYGVGYDNIDINAAKENNIVCMNTPDYGIDEVADTAVAMILALLRKIFHYNINSKKYKNFWQENVLQENLHNPIKRSSELSVGIIGFGRIGSAISSRLKPFGFKIGFYDPYLSSGYDKVFGVKKFTNLNDLVKSCDVISINSHLNKDTNSLVDKKFISKMKKNSILINTARGKIVRKLDDLYYGLKKGILGGVGLDVMPEEPPNQNEKLIKSWKNIKDPINKKIIINPHGGYYSTRSVIEMREKASQNLKNAIFKNIFLNKIN